MDTPANPVLKIPYHIDGKYAWLEFEYQLLFDLGIYSSQFLKNPVGSGSKIYLDEMTDANVALKVLKLHNIPYEFYYIWDGEESPIRKYIKL